MSACAASARPGFALVYTLLTTMALSLVALGIMARGRTEAEIARAVAAYTRARTAAEAAALDVVDAWSTRAHATLAVGATAPVGAVATAGATASTATITRLDRALFLVRAESRVDRGPTGPATASAGLLVRTLDPPALLHAFPAALTALEDADIQGGEVNGEDACGDTVPGIHAPTAVAGPGARVVGDPPVLREAPPGSNAPDPFVTPTAAVLATLTLRNGTHVPGPLVDSDACIEGPRNWGAIAPDHPCHALRPFLYAPGSITVTGGEGRGVLVVNGDARFRNGARFSGLLVVHGTLFVQDGSRLRGAIRATRAIVLDGSVHRDHCEITAATAAPALDRAFRPPGRWWVPAF